MLTRLALSLILLAPLGFASPSGAAPEGAVCQTDWVATLSNALTVNVTVGTYTSGGETGTIVCDGTVDGQQVTGPGAYGESGAYGPGPAGGGNCTNGVTSGDFTATIPTTAGTARITGPVTLHWAGPGAVIGDGPLSGLAALSFPTGDCVTEPAPQIRVRVQGILTVGS